MPQTRGRTRILVVDDDEDHATMLEVTLQSLGYDTATANSCARGVALLAEQSFDVLLADLTLGDGTAVDLLEAAGPTRPRVAIVLSGFDSAEDLERTRRAGFNAYMVKPASVEHLKEVLADHLGRKGAVEHSGHGVRP